MNDDIKQCRCGAVYDRNTWSELHLVGYQEVHEDEYGPHERLQLRDCRDCHSTLAVQVSP